MIRTVSLWILAIAASWLVALWPANAQEINPLASWLLDAELAWCPLSRHATRDKSEADTLSRYRDIAADVARVAGDPNEPPMYTGDGGRARTALVLLSLAFWESGFRGDVDSGTCKPPECDDGAATGLLQLHMGSGIVLDGDGWAYARARSPEWRVSHPANVVTAPDILRNRVLMFRVGLHMARRHIGAWTTSKRALEHARYWWTKRPFGGVQ